MEISLMSHGMSRSDSANASQKGVRWTLGRRLMLERGGSQPAAAQRVGHRSSTAVGGARSSRSTRRFSRPTRAGGACALPRRPT
eukprot:7294159-Prymnesium_polylepis.1